MEHTVNEQGRRSITRIIKITFILCLSLVFVVSTAYAPEEVSDHVEDYLVMIEEYMVRIEELLGDPQVDTFTKVGSEIKLIKVNELLQSLVRYLEKEKKIMDFRDKYIFPVEIVKTSDESLDALLYYILCLLLFTYILLQQITPEKPVKIVDLEGLKNKLTNIMLDFPKSKVEYLYLQLEELDKMFTAEMERLAQKEE